MNDEQLQGKWQQLKGKVQQKWGKLTDDDIQRIDGKRNELVGKIVERHGIKKEIVEKEVDKLMSEK